MELNLSLFCMHADLSLPLPFNLAPSPNSYLTPALASLFRFLCNSVEKRERDRERERQTDRQTDRERERERERERT